MYVDKHSRLGVGIFPVCRVPAVCRPSADLNQPSPTIHRTVGGTKFAFSTTSVRQAVWFLGKSIFDRHRPTINFHLPSSIPTSLSLSQKFEKHELCESEYMGPNLFDVQPSRQIQIPIFPNPPPSEKYTHFVRTPKTTTTHLVCLRLCGAHQVRQNQRQGLSVKRQNRRQVRRTCSRWPIPSTKPSTPQTDFNRLKP